MGNSVPSVEIEPSPLELQVRALTITPPRLPDVITLPTTTSLCSSLPEELVQTTIYTHIYVYVYIYIHIYT